MSADTEDDIIERCAQIADDHVRRLQVSKAKARTSRYDKQSVIEIDYATRQCKRIANSIRNTKTGRDPVFAPSTGPEHGPALALLKELLPSLERMRRSAWQADMVAKIKILLKDPGRIIS